ncbi:hypothetical protein TNCV_2790581 [Trichonephila clavipes]|nr:hypothetical protein TNCV_2790581 [Trichonephila clavipes]
MSSVRALVPQKFSVEEELMHVKHVEVKSPHVGVMWKFGRGVISSGIFDVKDAPRTGRHVVENVDKITYIIEVNRHVSSCSITQDPKIDHKTILSHLRKVGYKKKLHD